MPLKILMKSFQIAIDYYMIGPYDLSGSMGIVGDFKHSEYKKILIE